MNANTTPLEEVIPWSPNHPRTILVCDSIETDGGFVLSTMIAQLFSSHPPLPPPSSSSLKANATRTKRPERRQQRHPQTTTTTTTTPATSRALWLSGKASTERQVASDLKKLGCDAGAAYLKKSGGGNNNSNDDGGGNRRSNGLSIRSLALEIADRILDGKTSGDDDDDDDENDGRPFGSKEYLQSVYDDVKEWVGDGRRDEEEEGKITDADSASSSSLSWIVLDDVTALASMLGDTLVYCFVESLITLIHRRLEAPEDLGLILRCSGDVDQMLHRIEGTEGTDQTGWFGAGGLSHREAVRDALRGGSLVPWERAIEESVDAIVDVLPLPSGFSREAHGRLILSETPNGRGWKDAVRDRTNAPLPTSASSTTTTSSGSKQSKSSASGGGGGWNKLIFNYRLQDNGARAIRLRAR